MEVHAHISQRSIVAFSSLNGGTPAVGEWQPCQYRKPLIITAITPFTMSVSNWQTHGADASKIRPKWKTDGNTVDIEFLFDSTGYPSESYGVEATATFTLSVTTADDPARGLTGTTVTQTVNVLVLGYDFPYMDYSILDFHVGQTVNMPLSFGKRARHWNSVAVNTGFSPDDPAVAHLAAGKTAIVSQTKVYGMYAFSGLELYHEPAGELSPETVGTFYIQGTAMRPGIYRLAVDMSSTEAGRGQEEQVYHPYKGGDGSTGVIIWIWEHWQPGDLVLCETRHITPPSATHLRIVKCPGFGPDGYGEHLPDAQWSFNPQSRVWSATVSLNNGAIVFGYRLAPDADRGLWVLSGASSVAADTGYKTLATAPSRGFDDELPPKQGWTVALGEASSPLILTGDTRYCVSAAASSENAGWYSTAGTVELTPPEEDAEPVTITIYEREIHYIRPRDGRYTTAGAEGWDKLYGDPYRGQGIRYIAVVAGVWRVAGSAAAFDNYISAKSLPELGATVSAFERTAIPFCPAKVGDWGLHIPVQGSGGIAVSGGAVIHSLSRPVKSAGGLAVQLGNVAGVQWPLYPLRRLVDAGGVAATLTVEVHDYCSSSLLTGQRSDAITSGGTATADWMVENEATAYITTSTNLYWTSSRIVSSHTMTATLPLAYAIYTESHFIQELLNRQTSRGGITTSAENYSYHTDQNISATNTFDVRRPLNDPPYDNFYDPNYRWELTNVGGNATRRARYENADGSLIRTHTETISVGFEDGGITVSGKWVDTDAAGHVESGSIGYGGPLEVGAHLHPTAEHPDGALVLNVRYWSQDFSTEAALPKTAGATAAAHAEGQKSILSPGTLGSDDIAVNITATARFVRADEWDYSIPTNPGDEGWRPPCAYEKYQLRTESSLVESATSFAGDVASPVASLTSRTMRGNAFFGEGRDSSDQHRMVTLIAAGAVNLNAHSSRTYNGEFSATSSTYSSQWVANSSGAVTSTSSSAVTPTTHTITQNVNGGHGAMTGYAKFLVEHLDNGAVSAGFTSEYESATGYISGRLNSSSWQSTTHMSSSTRSSWATGMPSEAVRNSGGVVTSERGGSGASTVYPNRTFTTITDYRGSSVTVSGGQVIASGGNVPIGTGINVPHYTMGDIDFSSDAQSAGAGIIENYHVYSSRRVVFRCEVAYASSAK